LAKDGKAQSVKPGDADGDDDGEGSPRQSNKTEVLDMKKILTVHFCLHADLVDLVCQVAFLDWMHSFVTVFAKEKQWKRNGPFPLPCKLK